MGYIGVDDVDAYARRVKKSGGAIHRGPENIPGVGRFAVAGDPQGSGRQRRSETHDFPFHSLRPAKNEG